MQAVYIDVVAQRKKRLEAARHITVTLDGWSNMRMKSVMAANAILPSPSPNRGRGMELLGSEDASAERHTAENVAGGSLSNCMCWHWCMAGVHV